MLSHRWLQLHRELLESKTKPVKKGHVKIRTNTWFAYFMIDPLLGLCLIYLMQSVVRHDCSCLRLCAPWGGGAYIYTHCMPTLACWSGSGERLPQGFDRPFCPVFLRNTYSSTITHLTAHRSQQRQQQ